MVDAALFRKNNLNYLRPRISCSVEKMDSNKGWCGLESEQEVKSNNTNASQLKDDDLLLCSPTVRAGRALAVSNGVSLPLLESPAARE